MARNGPGLRGLCIISFVRMDTRFRLNRSSEDRYASSTESRPCMGRGATNADTPA